MHNADLGAFSENNFHISISSELIVYLGPKTMKVVSLVLVVGFSDSTLIESLNLTSDKLNLYTLAHPNNDKKLNLSDLYINYLADLPNYPLAFDNLAHAQIADQITHSTNNPLH